MENKLPATWVFLFAMLFALLTPASASPIGYEFLTNKTVLHIWNTKDDYYFNATSKIQFTNHYQEYWTKNIFCGGYKSITWNWWCFDELPWNDSEWSIDTDNVTYVNVTGSHVYNISGRDVRFGLRYHLKVNDPSLSVFVSAKNIGVLPVPNDIGFKWAVKDINISNTSENDFIEIVNITSNYTKLIYNLSEERDITFDNTTGKYELFDSATNEFAYLIWNPNLDYNLRIRNATGQFNTPTILTINGGPLPAGVEKTTKFLWRDASSFTSVQSGDWTNNATWNASSYPQAGDDATISSGDVVTINSSTNATVYEITVSNGGTLNISAGANLTFDDTANCGFGHSTGSIQGDLNINGNSTDRVTLTVVGASPTNNWTGSIANGDTWYATYADLDHYRAGLQNQGKLEWDNVNTTNQQTAFYIGNGFDDGTYIINTEFSNIVYFRGTAYVNHTFENITFQGYVFSWASVNATLDNIIINGLWAGVVSLGFDNFFGYHDYTFNNLTMEGRVLIGYYTGNVDFICNDCNIKEGAGIAHGSGKSYGHRRISLNNSNFSAVGNWDDVNFSNSYIASKNHNQIINNWQGWFYITNLSAILSDYRFDSTDNVTMNEGNLSANIDASMNALDVSAGKYIVTNDSITEGYKVTSMSGDIIITNGSFNNFTLVGMNNTRAWFNNASNIQLHNWSTLPAGGSINITGKAINVSNISTSGYMDLNISYTSGDLGILNESNLTIFRYNGTDWVQESNTSVDTTNNIVWALGITEFGEFVIGETVAIAIVDNPPVTALDSPADNYVNDTDEFVDLTFIVNATDDNNLVNCSFYHNATGTWHLNQTNDVTGTSNQTSYDLDDLTNVTFIWNAQCCDNASQCDWGDSNWTVILNWTAPPDNYPNVSLVDPLDGNVTSSNNVNFICNASDDSDLDNITFYWNYSGSWEANGTTDVTGTFNETTFDRTNLDNGTYLWNCYACDNASQCNWSISNWTVTVNYSAPTCVDPGNRTTPYYINNDTTLCTGVYNINITNSASFGALTINASNVTLDCDNSIIIGNGTGSGIFTNYSNVTIENCNVTNYQYGIRNRHGGDYNLITNNLIYENTEYGILCFASPAWYTQNLTIADNTLRGNEDYDIYCRYLNNVTIDNNYINTTSGDHSLLMIDSNDMVVKNNRAYNASKTPGYSASYYFDYSNRGLLHNNTATDSSRGTTFYVGWNNSITSNTFNNAGGIRMRHGGGNNASSNTVTNSAHYGVIISAGGNTYIESNTVSNASIGIHVSGTEDSTITQNELYNTTNIINFSDSSTNIDFVNNSWGLNNWDDRRFYFSLATNISVNNVTDPVSDGVIHPIGKGINISGYDGTSIMNLSIYYLDGDIVGTESDLLMYKYDGSWTSITETGVVVAENYVWGNSITTFPYLFSAGSPVLLPLDIIIISPYSNQRFPYSISLPFRYNTTGATDCYYTLTDGVQNFTTECGLINSSFDVDFDKNYTLTLYASNATAALNGTVLFSVLRNLEGGGIWMTIVFIIAGIAVFFLVASASMSKEHLPLQLFFLGMSFWIGIMALEGATFGIREYLKTPYLLDNIYTIYNIAFWVFFAIFTVVIITIIYNTLKVRKEAKLNEFM